jgi:hypothetical protein
MHIAPVHAAADVFRAAIEASSPRAGEGVRFRTVAHAKDIAALAN